MSACLLDITNFVKEKADQLIEATYADVDRKQRSINQLFPTFPKRVNAVASHGGIRLVSTRGNLWKFKLHSGTVAGKEYDGIVKFPNLKNMIIDKVKNPELWNKEHSAIDHRKLAADILFDVDLELFCSCPADLYWGGHYIRTHRFDRNAKYSRPENRPPEKRNPHQYGALCKHLQLLMNQLPMYSPTLAAQLKDKYGDLIKDLENQAKPKEQPKPKEKEKEPKPKSKIQPAKKEEPEPEKEEGDEHV
jgi:hypothetical protein